MFHPSEPCSEETIIEHIEREMEKGTIAHIDTPLRPRSKIVEVFGSALVSSFTSSSSSSLLSFCNDRDGGDPAATLLDLAIFFVQPRVVRYLLRRRAKPRPDSVSKLCSCASVWNEDDAIIIIDDLAIAGADFSDEEKILENATRNGLVSLVKVLLQLDIPSSTSVFGEKKFRNNNFTRALCVAAETNMTEICRLLLDAGADINRPRRGERDYLNAEEDYFPPLFLACKRGRVGVVRLLLERHASLERRLTDIEDRDAAVGGFASGHILVAACSGCSIECLKWIVEICRSSIQNNVGHDTMLASFCACVKWRRFSCFEYLLEKFESIYAAEDPMYEDFLFCEVLDYVVSNEILKLEEEGYYFLQILLTSACQKYVVSLKNEKLVDLVRKDAIRVLELLLTDEHVLVEAGKKEFEILIDKKVASSGKMKEILKTRIENIDQNGKLIIPKVKNEKNVNNHEEEVEEENNKNKNGGCAGSRRQRNEDEDEIEYQGF